MPFCLRLAPLTAAVALLAGCGGSSHPVASTATTVTATSPSTSPLPTVSASVSSSAAASSTARRSARSGSSVPGSGGVAVPTGSGAAAGGSPGATGGGAIDARVPASFTLGAHGALSPSQVSAPAFLAVAVRIHSASSSAHTVTIATAPLVRLTIPAHGAGGTTIRGLRAGTYPILVDGVRRAALAIGGEPGP